MTDPAGGTGPREPPGWSIVCRSGDLGRRPLAVCIDGRRLVAFRTSHGVPGLLDDRCAHRGTPLSSGSVHGDCVRCPYHGWEYGTDGSLCLVPAMRDRPETWAAVKLGALPCTEHDGYLWARTGGDATGQPHRFKHLGEAGWTSFRMRTRFRATVAACLENFLDCPHATFVHRHWFRAPTAKPVRCSVRTLSSGAEAEFFDEPREKSAVWWLLAPRAGPMRHVDRFIAPNTSEVEYVFPNGLHYVITSSCTPVSADETIVHTVISFRSRLPGTLIRLFFEPLSRLIIRQDVRMLARAHDNPANDRAAGFAARFASTPADVLGPHIHAWRHALRSGMPPPAAGCETQVELRL